MTNNLHFFNYFFICLIWAGDVQTTLYFCYFFIWGGDLQSTFYLNVYNIEHLKRDDSLFNLNILISYVLINIFIFLILISAKGKRDDSLFNLNNIDFLCSYVLQKEKGMIAYSTCAAKQTINFVVVCRPAGRANYQYVTFQILNLPISILLKATTLFL